MTMRKKTMLIVGLVVLTLIGGQHFITNLLLERSIFNTEHRSVLRRMTPTSDIIYNELNILDRICTDYGYCDDTYQLMSNPQDSHSDVVIDDQSLLNLNINFIFYLDPTGKILFSQSANMTPEDLQAISKNFIQTTLLPLLSPNHEIFTHYNGILMLESEPVMVSANSILPHDGEGPSCGTLVMIRRLNSDYLRHLSKLANADLVLFLIGNPGNPEDVRRAVDHLTKGDLNYTTPISGDSLAGYTFISDLRDQPQFVLKMTSPREVYATAISDVKFNIISILLISTILGIVMYLLLEKLVLVPLARLNSHVNQVARLSDFSVRIPVEGKDELSNVSLNLNNMLAALESSDQKIKISESKLRSIFASSPNGISVTDLEGHILDANQAALEVFGFNAKEDVIGRSIVEFVPAPERHRALKDLEKVRAEKLLKNVEYTLMKRDRSTFPAELSASLVQDPGTDFTCLVIIFRDISARKQAEDELRLNEALLRSMADSSPLAFYVTNSDTDEILFFNRRFCEIWGIENLETRMRQEGIKASEINAYLFSRVNDTESFQKSYRQLHQVENRKTLEVEIPFSDGRIIRRLSSQIRDGQDQYMGRLCIFEDVTDHKRAERALSLSEHRFRILFERNLAGVYLSTPEGRVIDCNDSFAHIFGYGSPKEALASAAETVFVLAADREAYLNSRQGRGSTSNFEFKFRRRDGSPIWVMGTSTLILGEVDEPLMIQGTVMDITEQKLNQERERELQVELIQQSKLAGIGMLAAGIAHNVNVPLQGIIMHVELLKMTHPDFTGLDEILNQAMRISAIIQNMLHKSRQEQSQAEQEIDLNKLIAEELEFLNADMLFKHEINKSYDFDPYLPRVFGIYSDFSQTLLNLIRNSIDAMHEARKKWLTIRTAVSEAAEITIEIQDTGCGIRPEIRDRIFEPFFSTKPLVGQQLADEPTGTGLGLSSALQLMRRYEAKFEIQSDIGQGTTFRIIIPHQHKDPAQSSENSPLCEQEVEAMIA